MTSSASSGDSDESSGQKTGQKTGKSSGSAGGKRKSLPVPKQTFFVKIIHTLLIVSLLIMIISGLQIYNANPVFGGRGGWHFPRFMSLGGLARGRDWHFAFMWVFSLNLLIYGIYIGLTKRWKRRFASGSDLKVLGAGQNPKRLNYAWHRLAYTGIVPVLLLAIASGLAMYKPVQLHWLASLFVSWQVLRVVHFVTVPIVTLFVFVHVLLGLKVGGFRLIRSMFNLEV
jgi:thiosulfate reductase cytochrome b subunit